MDWKLSTALQKGLSRLVQYAVVLLTTGKVAGVLATAGVAVNVNPVVATSAILGSWEVIRNFLKLKLGWKFL